MMNLSEEEHRAIAFLIERHRERAGHSTWHRPGIVPVVADLDAQGLTVPAIVAAGYAAAGDPSAVTPQAITFERYAPRKAATSTPDTAAQAGPVCRGCGFPEAKHNRVSGKAYPAHRFEPDPDREPTRRIPLVGVVKGMPE